MLDFGADQSDASIREIREELGEEDDSGEIVSDVNKKGSAVV